MKQTSKQKKRFYTKDDFSDKEVYNEIKDQIKIIRDRNLKQLEEDSLINNLYETKKKQIKLKRIKINEESRPKVAKERDLHELGEEDQQQGEIKKATQEPHQKVQQARASFELIKSTVLTRLKAVELLRAKKFEQIALGCFVRYKDYQQNQSRSESQNAYRIGYVIEVVKGQKPYMFENAIKTNYILKARQSSQKIQKITLSDLSNCLPGSLQATKWIQQNQHSVPYQEVQKKKLAELKQVVHTRHDPVVLQQNILEQARNFANDSTQQPAKQIRRVLQFVKSCLHDATIKCEQLQRDKDKSNQYTEILKQKQKYQILYQKLSKKQKEAVQRQAKIRQAAQNDKKQIQRHALKNNYQHYDIEKDKIKQNYYDRYLKLTTPQGAIEIREELIKAHNQFDIDVEI